MILLTVEGVGLESYLTAPAPLRMLGTAARPVLGLPVRRISFPVTLTEDVHGCAVETAGEDSALTAWPRVGVHVPSSLQTARPRRVATFLAGRYAAMTALSAHGYDDAPQVAIGPDGAPCWPAGFVGTITHTDNFAGAAVARLETLSAIGIDAERLLSTSEADEIAPQVCPELRGQRQQPREGSVRDWATLVTVVFSAKESLYKCLRPLVGVFFSFHEVKAVASDGRSQRLRLRLDRDLGHFPRGTELDAGFAIEGGFVHTVIELRTQTM